MITEPQIEREMSQLGIRREGSLFVHSSIKAVGSGVDPAQLITALRTAVGDDGTLLFPTFTAREETCFDPGRTPSVMGAVAETFRQLPGVIRSCHPRHPVAAQGPLAHQLLAGHESAPGPCGIGTPFEKHARGGGQILLLGVDLDTLTLLHTAEALLDLPYLSEVKGTYQDKNGDVQEVAMRQTPGGHRGGVRRFEKPLRDRGLVRYGQIGRARTMLLEAGPTLDMMIEILRGDPTAALCKNESCPDCVDFRSKIRAQQLRQLGAQLCIVLPGEPQDRQVFKELIRRFGVPPQIAVEADLKIVRLESGERPPAPPDNEKGWVLQPAVEDLTKFEGLPTGYTGLAYSPLDAAKQGIQPFYDVLYKGPCRDLITDIFLSDGICDLPGFSSPGLTYLDRLYPDGQAVLGTGHAQLREIISAMRMRSFAGRYHLVIPDGNLFAQALRLLHEFWDLLP